jgi:RNA polymerase sigma-70 factor, ECF subfamily
LGPTALAHEAYLRLARETRSDIAGRTHLLAVAATAMRRVIIDHARARRSAKRGGGAAAMTLNESLVGPASRPIDLLDLHRALDQLAAEHPRKVRIVEMIYFAGLTAEETAATLEISERTVLRDWKFARAWLWRELKP